MSATTRVSRRKAKAERGGAEQRRGWPNGRLLGGAVLLALVVLSYAASLEGGFIWDDKAIYIVNNALLRADDGLFRFWFGSETSDYYPLTYTTFWLEWRVWGDHPLGYRVVNLALHFCTAVLIWRLLVRFKAPWAWLAAALFAVHPVNVETVAWISQRKSLLAAVFGFAAMWAYVEHQERPRRSFYLLSLGCFCLSLAGKPTLITMPLVMVAYGIWMGHRFDMQTIRRFVPFLAAAAVFGMVGIWFQEQIAIGEHDVRTQNFAERLATAGWASWFYIGKTLFPWNLMFIYPRWNVDAASPLAWAPTLALVGCLALAWRRRQHWGRPVLAGLGFFLITMLPALGFFDVYFWRYSYVGDHYQYQSMIGIIALALWFVHRVACRLALGSPLPLRLAATSVLATLSLLTCRYALTFQDDETIWKDTLRKNPSAFIAYGNLGDLHKLAGRYEEAIDMVRRGLEIKPDDSVMQFTLADALRLSGKHAEAEREYERLFRITPHQVDPLVGMAINFTSQGKYAEAISPLKQALERKTSFPWAAQRELGIALCALGDHAQGQEAYRNALRLAPNHAEIHQLLAASLEASGNPAGAARHFEQAATALASAGRFDEAVSAATRAEQAAIAAGDAALADEMGRRLKLYRGEETLVVPSSR